MKTEADCLKLEHSLKNVILMTVEAGLLLLFGIIVTVFDVVDEKTEADIQWGWAICAVALIILGIGLATSILIGKKIKAARKAITEKKTDENSSVL